MPLSMLSAIAAAVTPRSIFHYAVTDYDFLLLTPISFSLPPPPPLMIAAPLITPTPLRCPPFFADFYITRWPLFLFACAQRAAMLAQRLLFALRDAALRAATPLLPPLLRHFRRFAAFAMLMLRFSDADDYFFAACRFCYAECAIFARLPRV
jgi:hypothetical protein